MRLLGNDQSIKKSYGVMSDDDDDDFQEPVETIFPPSVRIVVYLTQMFDRVGLTMFLPLFPYIFKDLR